MELAKQQSLEESTKRDAWPNDNKDQSKKESGWRPSTQNKINLTKDQGPDNWEDELKSPKMQKLNPSVAKLSRSPGVKIRSILLKNLL